MTTYTAYHARYYLEHRDEIAARKREYYLENRNRLKGVHQAQRQRRRAERDVVIDEFLSMHPCRACGEGDTDVLQFHHLQPGSREPSTGVTHSQRSWAWFWAEVLKCVVLCANCHVRFHKLAAQLGVKY